MHLRWRHTPHAHHKDTRSAPPFVHPTFLAHPCHSCAAPTSCPPVLPPLHPTGPPVSIRATHALCLLTLVAACSNEPRDGRVDDLERDQDGENGRLLGEATEGHGVRAAGGDFEGRPEGPEKGDAWVGSEGGGRQGGGMRGERSWRECGHKCPRGSVGDTDSVAIRERGFRVQGFEKKTPGPSMVVRGEDGHAAERSTANKCELACVMCTLPTCDWHRHQCHHACIHARSGDAGGEESGGGLPGGPPSLQAQTAVAEGARSRKRRG